MKAILTLVLSFCFLQVHANPVFTKLVEVNSLWKEQQDVRSLPDYSDKSETEWIRQHLTLVEQTLRSREVSHLTPQQRQNRLRALDNLHQYMLAGAFPVNDDYSYRTPIFIDKHDNFCAVGYLVKASGNEQVSRMIASKTNLAYVREMNYPELTSWANEYGFTTDELAWIQPAYPPTRKAEPVGKGTDGEVFELFPDNGNNKLYVGGLFSTVDSTVSASNIAYLTESNGNYTWHNMGTGVNGPVYAIAEHNGKIFVAGSFTMAGSANVSNVAYWDGNTWHDAACLNGVVKDLLVFNNELYAAGQFDVCASLSDVNFAKWNGSLWQPIDGLMGVVNTMEVMNGSILLGGNFTYGAAGKNVVKWTPGNGFEAFANSIANEVRDFEWWADTVYAACKRTDANDSLLFLKLKNNSWESGLIYPVKGDYTFNSLCLMDNTLQVGGEFELPVLIGTPVFNSWNLTPPYAPSSNNYFSVDSAVNKLVMFKGTMYAGGKFNVGYSWPPTSLNGMAKVVSTTGIQDVPGTDLSFSIYPNPAASGGWITVDNNFKATRFVLRDINGKTVAVQPLSHTSQQVTLPAMAAGVYLGEVSNNQGQKVTKKMVIE